MQFNGASLLIELLKRQGIESVAGIPGGANLPLYDALGRSNLRHVLVRHEQAGGFMAQGIARSTGKAAVCFATSGPGAVNLLTAIADAKLDSIPIVAVTGQVATALIGTDAFQEVDTYGMTIPVTKHNFLVRGAAELLEVVPEAFRLALSGRPGPVLIDLPKDVQQATIELDSLPAPGAPDPAPEPDGAALAHMARMIAAAERPLLYVGGGVVASGAEAEVRALSARCGIPVVTTLMGLGIMEPENPLGLGMLGMHGSRATNFAVDRTDLLIALGVRFDDRATGSVAAFAPHARVIHMDIDEAEFGKIRRPDISSGCDLAPGSETPQQAGGARRAPGVECGDPGAAGRALPSGGKRRRAPGPADHRDRGGGPPGLHRHRGCRPAPDVGGPVVAGAKVQEFPHFRRAWHHGVLGSRGHGGGHCQSGQGRRCPHGGRLDAHEHPGAGYDRRKWFRRPHLRAEQRPSRSCPPAAGTVLRQALRGLEIRRAARLRRNRPRIRDPRVHGRA